jgi:phosphate starvation-inducible PhoH-like protein
MEFADPKREHGEPKKEEKKRPGRKAKKQTEKEIMHEYNMDQEKTANSNLVIKQQRKIYENFQYLSAGERELFDQKFTKPKTNSQEIYASMLKAKNKKIILATGPAGTGKTLFATEYGVRYFLQGTYEKLIFTRPSVSVDEELGFLPGTMEEKMAPWVRPIYDVLYQFMSPKEVTVLMEEKVIEIAPLGYMRGRTFKNCWIVADEMQNSTISQMKMLLTRLGENSRLVITGDLEQYDRPNETNGLEDFLDKFRGRRSSSIGSFEFNRSDIQREEVVKEILDIYGGDIPANYTGETDGVQQSLCPSDPFLPNSTY